MAGTGKKWLIGCGVGCAVFMVLGILLTVGGGILMMRPFSKAVDKQELLVEQYGAREDFIPLPDGLTSDRVQAFLAVRKEMMAHCSTFEEITASFQAMDTLDQSEEEPPIGDILKGVGNVMGSAFSFAGEIGALTNSRNNELIKNGMGLGEYVWIYVLAYNSWLGFEPNTEYEGDQSEGFSEREGRLVKQLMLNHARALEEVERHDEANLWRDEAGRLSRSEGRVPFHAGDLPAEMVAAFAPYRAQFEATYCPAMSQFDLNNLKKKGLSIQTY